MLVQVDRYILHLKCTSIALLRVAPFLGITIILGLAGWLLYGHIRQNPPAGIVIPVDWAAATLQHDGATFRYPKTWKVSIDNCRNPNVDGSCTDDQATLTGPNGFTMDIQTGTFGPFMESPPMVVGNIRVKFIGESGYIGLMAEDTAAPSQDPQYNGRVAYVQLLRDANGIGDSNSLDTDYFRVKLLRL